MFASAILTRPPMRSLAGSGLPVEQRLDRGGRVALQVHQRGRRPVAQPQAAHGFEGVRTVGRGLAGADAQPRGHLLGEFRGAGHRARPVLAHADHPAADRLRVEHLVELRDAVHVGDGDLQVFGDALDRGTGQPAAVDLLRIMQHFQQDGSPTGAVAGQHGFQLTVFSIHAEHLLMQKIGVNVLRHCTGCRFLCQQERTGVGQNPMRT